MKGNEGKRDEEEREWFRARDRNNVKERGGVGGEGGTSWQE